ANRQPHDASVARFHADLPGASVTCAPPRIHPRDAAGIAVHLPEDELIGRRMLAKGLKNRVAAAKWTDRDAAKGHHRVGVEQLHERSEVPRFNSQVVQFNVAAEQRRSIIGRHRSMGSLEERRIPRSRTSLYYSPPWLRFAKSRSA